MIESERNLNPKEFKGFLPIDEFKTTFANILKETQDPLEKINMTRAFLELMVSIDPDSIEGVFNIKVIERNSDIGPQEDCFTYLVGKKVDIQKFHDDMFETHTLSRKPIPGAYALYLKNEKEELKATHIGRVTGDLTVISKWGLTGHVYEHLPELVPISYGSKIAYYIPPKN
jgi:hypothetical protein